MFVSFFTLLRSQKIPVTLTEFLTLLEALGQGHSGASLDGFYFLARAILVKNEAFYDIYDEAFSHFFAGTELSQSLDEEILQWLKDPKLPRPLSEEERRQLEAYDLDRLRDLFEQRLREQKERHDGGNRWIGTGGTSPFGHGGYHPSGIRVGGSGGGRHAMQVASARLFRNLRNDVVLDTRQMGVALRKLRRLTREGLAEELDIDASIRATSDNAGEIELRFRPNRKNHVRLLLLMDVGGSMTPYSMLCERLFSAAHHGKHFKEFRSYYFHNCPYETLYEDMERREGLPTMDILGSLDEQWNVMIVGDAAMSPYELLVPGGSVDYFHHNDTPGYVWLNRIKERCPRTVWLNPEPQAYWQIESNQIVRRLIPDMFPLTIQGLEQAITCLRQNQSAKRA